MSEFLFFILGLMIGGLTMTTVLCSIQINRVNKLEEDFLIKRDNESNPELEKCEKEK